MSRGRIRTVKPEWRQDQRLLRSGHEARIFSIVLLTLADDEGRGRWIELGMAAEAFPFDPDPVASLRKAVAGLSGWYLHVYEIDGEGYFQILKFRRHQRIEKTTKSRIPECLDLTRVQGETGVEYSVTPPGVFRESSSENSPPPLSKIQDPVPSPRGSGGDLKRTFRSPQAGAIALVLDEVFAEANEATPSATDAHLNAAAKKLMQASERGGRTLDDLSRSMARGFLADPKARAAGWPGSWLANNPMQWVNSTPRKPPSASDLANDKEPW